MTSYCHCKNSFHLADPPDRDIQGSPDLTVNCSSGRLCNLVLVTQSVTEPLQLELTRVAMPWKLSTKRLMHSLKVSLEHLLCTRAIASFGGHGDAYDKQPCPMEHRVWVRRFWEQSNNYQILKRWVQWERQGCRSNSTGEEWNFRQEENTISPELRERCK